MRCFPNLYVHICQRVERDRHAAGLDADLLVLSFRQRRRPSHGNDDRRERGCVHHWDHHVHRITPTLPRCLSRDQLAGAVSSTPAPGSTIQFFATKVNTTVISTGGIAYSTYFGGANGTIATGGGIAVDTTGNMYFSGTTNFYNSGNGQYGDSNSSVDFPILNAYQPCLDTPPPVVLGNPNHV